jgi:hypothetical protein
MISFQSAAMKNQLAIGRPIFEEDLNFPAAQFQKLELSPILLSNQLETIQKSAEVSKKTLGREAKLFRVRTLRIIASRTEQARKVRNRVLLAIGNELRGSIGAFLPSFRYALCGEGVMPVRCQFENHRAC